MASLSPDELSQNELICERLLGWKRGVRGCISNAQFWDTGGLCDVPTPSFTTWAEAGLILDALQGTKGFETMNSCSDLGWLLKTRTLTTGAIRAAALEYIKAVQP